MSGSQLALKLNRLAKAKSVKALIVRELAEQDSPDADRAVEDVLDFVRTWAGFHFPRYLMALHRVQQAVYMEWIGAAGDYSAYAASVENMFSTSGLVALDEYGVPLQIAEKMRPHFGEYETVDQALQQLRRIDVRRVSSLTDFERELVRDAQAGLGAEVGVPEKSQGERS